MLFIAFYCLIVMAASLAGGWLPAMAKLTHERMQVLVSMVAGLMLGVAILHLLPHAAMFLQSVDLAAAWMLAGVVAMYFFLRAFHNHSHESSHPDVQHAHADEARLADSVSVHDCHDHPAPRRGVGWMGAAAGLTLHSLIDGAALSAAVAADLHSQHGFGLPGLGTLLAVTLHKPLDSLSITSLMTAQGCPVRMRTIVNLAYSCACPIGAGLFWFGFSQQEDGSNSLIGAALAFAAGIFICVSCCELLPEIELRRHERFKLSSSLLGGILIAYAIGFIEPPHAPHLGHESHAHHHSDHDGAQPFEKPSLPGGK